MGTALLLVTLAAKVEGWRPTKKHAGRGSTHFEKKKLDKQLEEARKDSQLPQANAVPEEVEMEVGQIQDLPQTSIASSSSGTRICLWLKMSSPQNIHPFAHSFPHFLLFSFLLFLFFSFFHSINTQSCRKSTLSFRTAFLFS